MVKKLFAATVLSMLFLGVMLPAGTAQRTVYQNDKYGFSIAPPIGWTIEESDDDPSVIVFWSPLKNNYSVPMAIVIKENVPNLPTVFVESTKEAIKLWTPDAQIISEGSRMINGIEAYELTYNYTYTTVDGVLDLQTKQVILFKDRTVYLFGLNAPQDYYDEYLPLFEESIGTLKFEEKRLLQKIFDRCLP